MPTPLGYADVSIQFTRGDMTRMAYVTFGVAVGSLTMGQVVTGLVSTYAGAGGLAAMIDNSAAITQTRVSYGTASNEDTVAVDGTNVAGTKSIIGPPPSVCLLIHKQSDRGGRRGRGRMFLPNAIANADLAENGTLLSASVTALTTAFNLWVAKIATANLPMAILHSPGKTAPGSPNLVTSFSIDKIVGTQRRRLGR
jgi:hypothetical protein